MNKTVCALAACGAGMFMSVAGLVIAQQPPTTGQAATMPSGPVSTQPTDADPLANEPDPVKKSAAVMRQIGQAIVMYCNDNRGFLPADLKLLSTHRYLRDDVAKLKNPRTGAEPGYEYVSPGPRITRIKNATTVPMLWELDADGKRLDDGLVLFLDGHVEKAK